MTGKLWVLAALLIAVAAAPASAQRVMVRGIVDRVETDTGVVWLRKMFGTQPVLVTADADLRINERPGTLGEIAYNAQVDGLAWRDRSGRLHADILRVEQPEAPGRPAAVEPGTVVTGEVVGLNPNAGLLILRTPVGFRNVAVGTAPVLLNGRPVTPFDLALGDRVQVRYEVPRGGRAPVPAIAVVLTAQTVAGYRETFRAAPAPASPAPAPSVPGSSSPAGAPAPGGSAR